ncbi:MAG: hypothetical protein Q8M19_02665, partial [Reyranella sp.]|nr:hypothetical protein [Reyranella sp.]
MDRTGRPATEQTARRQPKTDLASTFPPLAAHPPPLENPGLLQTAPDPSIAAAKPAPAGDHFDA